MSTGVPHFVSLDKQVAVHVHRPARVLRCGLTAARGHRQQSANRCTARQYHTVAGEDSCGDPPNTEASCPNPDTHLLMRKMLSSTGIIRRVSRYSTRLTGRTRTASWPSLPASQNTDTHRVGGVTLGKKLLRLGALAPSTSSVIT